MRGVPLPQVQAWMGNSTILVTMKYAHLAHGIGDELIGRLAPERRDGPKSRRRGAGPQHMGNTSTRRKSKTAVKPGLGDGS